MADSKTETDDWQVRGLSLNTNHTRGISSFKALIYSESLKLVHEFHLNGAQSDTSFPEFFAIDFDFPSRDVYRFSLYSLRGLDGRFEMNSRHQEVEVRAYDRSSSVLFYAKADYTYAGNCTFNGIWLLKQPRVYHDVIR